MMGGPRKKAPKTIAVIDPDSCFGAFACSICQAACPVAGCIVEEPDRDGRMVCAVRARPSLIEFPADDPERAVHF